MRCTVAGWPSASSVTGASLRPVGILRAPPVDRRTIAPAGGRSRRSPNGVPPAECTVALTTVPGRAARSCTKRGTSWCTPRHIRGPRSDRTSSSTSWSWKMCSDATLSPTRTFITETASVMTTDRRISSCGPDRSQPASVLATQWIGPARSSNSTPTSPKACKPYTCAASTLVEVKGIEPLCPGDRLGLLRAEPMHRSRPSVSIGRGPRGQSGCVVPRRPPNRTGGVSLLR